MALTVYMALAPIEIAEECLSVADVVCTESATI